MNAPLVAVNIPSLQMAEDELVRVLESSLYPGAKLESIKLVVGYCKGQNLDPLLKPVHIVPMSVKKTNGDGYEMRDVIMPGVGLYRTTAARTGEYAGVTEPEFGSTVTLNLGDFRFDYPEWCRVTVYREVNGQLRAFTAKEFWIENYATKARDSKVPNAMWQKRPIGQLAKCTEAQALRKAFPEVGTQPTAEEMAGKELGVDGETIDGTATTVPTPQIEQPKPKTESTEKAEHRPISAGAIKTITAAMERAALGTPDLHKTFGVNEDGTLIEGWTIQALGMHQVNQVLDWCRNPAGAK